MPSVTQRSFAGGAISPALYARADLNKYKDGVKILRNFFVAKDGSAENRAGTEWGDEVGDSSAAARLVPFVFNASQAYQLLFQEGTIRIIVDNAYLTVSPAAYQAPGTGVLYYTGDIFSYLGVNYYTIHDGYNTTPLNTLYFYAMPSNLLEIPTPYLESELAELQFTQSADVMTITHPNHPIMELRRQSATKWRLTDKLIGPGIGFPRSCTGTAGGAGANVYRYQITAVNAAGEESLVGDRTTAFTIASISQANPCVVTTTAPHGFVTGDIVRIYIDLGVVSGGMPELKNRVVVITVTGATTFTIDGVDSTGFAPLVGGASVSRAVIRITSAAVPTSSAPIVLTWAAPFIPALAGREAIAVYYNVYRELNGEFLFIGTASGLTFSDINYAPVSGEKPPTDLYLFSVPGDYPAAVTYAQQRIVFAGTDNAPEEVQASRVGAFNNFTRQSPITDSDALAFTPVGRRVNAVKALIEVGRLLILTGGGVFSANGDSNGDLTPSSPGVRLQSSFGANDLRPLIVGDTMVYVQDRGQVVRSLRYSFQDDGFQGTDMTLFASHLLRGRTIVDWDYQEIPNSIVWLVLDDGAMLGMTTVREQEILAWHQQDTDGLVENVSVIPEGGEDRVYLLVNRTINGATKRYFERMASRQVFNIADSWFVDCGLEYDGRNTGATTLTLSGSGWTPSDTLTLTASAGQFIAGDVGNEYVLIIPANPRAEEGDADFAELSVRCLVTTYTSATEVSVTPDVDVPVAFQGVAFTDWARAVDEVSGLDHLEGKTVSILAEGSVFRDGVTAPLTTVAAGTVTLDRPYYRILVGLPITADLEMLDLEDPENETLRDKRLLINEVTLLVQDSRPPEVGSDKDHTRPVKDPSPADDGEAPDLITGSLRVSLNSTWNDNGRVFIRHTDPTPLTLLGVVRHGRVEKAPN